MIVARRAVADRARGLVWWSVGIVGLVLFTVALFPSIEGNDDFDRLVADLPEAMRSTFSLDTAVPISSAPGYLQSRLFGSLLPLLLVIFAVSAGARAVAGSEEDGTLELLLVHPVSRVRVALERYAAVVMMVGLLTAVSLVSLFALSPLFGALRGVSLVGLLGAGVGAGCLALLHGTLAFAVGAIWGRRSSSVGVAAVVGVAGYLVQGLGSVSSVVSPLRVASPWHWYLARNMLAAGASLAAVVLPVVCCAVLVPVAVRVFVRRDLR